MRKHRHICSYGVIIRDDKILLIRKARGAYTGKLDLPGGGFEHRETPIECVTREINEEAGVTVKSVKLMDVFSFNVQWNDADDVEDLHHLGVMFEVECNDELIKEDADGLDSLGSAWYDISSLSEDLVSPFTYMALKKLGYNI